MNNAGEILAEIERSRVEGVYEYTIEDAGEDRDGETCHVVLRPRYNQCRTLIAMCLWLEFYGYRITALHQLGAQYIGCFELDLIQGHQPTKKSWRVYAEVVDEPTDDHPF